MCYLIVFKDYSVICRKDEQIGKTWSACDSLLEFDYGHDGVWADGETPQDAIYWCWKSARHAGRI